MVAAVTGAIPDGATSPIRSAYTLGMFGYLVSLSFRLAENQPPRPGGPAGGCADADTRPRSA
jgi:hypothetical protein